jgi:hypothetical protein
MSRNAAIGESEGIDRISRSRRLDVRLETFPVHHIDRPFEQAGNIRLDSGIFPHADGRLGINFDHDVGIALGTVITPSPRAEQSGMRHSALSQRRFVFPVAGL